MDYLTQQSFSTHFEYVADRRPEVYSVKQHALAYMDYLEGWCSPQKADFLLDLVLQSKPQKIVEIGVWNGKSLIPIAYALHINQSGRIYGIDPWDSSASLQGLQNEDNKYFWYSADHGRVYKKLVQKLQEFNLIEQVELVTTTSEKALPIYDIDILHIDGNHSQEASFHDVQKWVPFVKKGGYIIFDDMNWFENGVYTTQKAVNWLNEHCFPLAEFTDVCIWGIWVKL